MPEEARIPPARHEERDSPERLIWITVAATSAMLLACGALTLWLYPDSRLDRTLHLPLPRYPEPRLQTDPSADMRTFHSEEMRRLTDGERAAEGVSREPIDEAMRQVARDGIPGWPGERSSP